MTGSTDGENRKPKRGEEEDGEGSKGKAASTRADGRAQEKQVLRNSIQELYGRDHLNQPSEAEGDFPEIQSELLQKPSEMACHETINGEEPSGLAEAKDVLECGRRLKEKGFVIRRRPVSGVYGEQVSN